MRKRLWWAAALGVVTALAAGCGQKSAAGGGITPMPAGDPVAGARLYSTTCEQCHGPTGEGIKGAYPSLLRMKDFKRLYGNQAGLAGFIQHNMPFTDPGSLTKQQAADAAAFIYALNGQMGASTKAQVLAALNSGSSSAASSASSSTSASGGSSTANLSAEVAAGQQLWSKVCYVCHGSNGQGGNGGPALWGPNGVIKGGPYANLSALSAFIKSNMPAAPTNGYKAGSLSTQQATGLAAYILSQNHLLSK
ncbi:Cytochrome c family protein [Candidatus Hydrogenisulfobacillus filiaventi]|uniref:Cytochrome c family protein n=1 Tax=Candidatus Hydrogenisulfobacillus filiaventi TaxID=2707344 RepID=A0A6F8ZHD7_9FIRM|nr:c-type cytochrome [Bacillota bacterium]CAB1129297.1 Cytochrome c family protein [Candidatus Hydrogenisulfobacillus filiaventi]